MASRIVSLADPDETDVILEPGAGYGTLTEVLSVVARRVIAVEKDRRLASYLSDKFRDNEKVQVVSGDVLRTPLPEFNRVVGTPPYNISSKLILLLLSSKCEAAHLVFQKEFGDRLLARPGTGHYGRLSVMAQRKLYIRSVLSVPRTSFYPSPKVDSVLLDIQPKTDRRLEVDDAVFEELVRSVFNQRRRLLRGALSRYLLTRTTRERAREIAGEVAFPEARVYQLSVEQLEELAVHLQEALQRT